MISLDRVKLKNPIRLVDNSVILIHIVLISFAPFVHRFAIQNRCLDRFVDVLFGLYLCFSLIRFFFNPTFRVLVCFFFVGAFAFIGALEAYYAGRIGAYFYEAKIFVSIFLFLTLLDQKIFLSERLLKVLFWSFGVSSLLFVLLNPGYRLYLINESNYLCMCFVIVLFSYLRSKGGLVSSTELVMYGVFSVWLIVVTQSRTGMVIIGLAWLIYVTERWGRARGAIVGGSMVVLGTMGAFLAVSVGLPVVDRFAALKDFRSVDRYIYLTESSRFFGEKPMFDKVITFDFSKPTSDKMDEKMKWMTNKDGLLYPRHFHLTYLRILVGHGVVPLLFFIIAMVWVWSINPYLSLALAFGSMSMSVPYLSLFWSALHLSMALRKPVI